MPDWKKEIRQRLAALDLDPTREAGVVEELAGHAEDYFAEQLRQGVAEQEAFAKTVAQLSDTKLSQDLLRSAPRPLFSRRFPFPLRVLAKHWRLTSVAVISLSVAIAAAAVGFSVFNALLLRPPTSAHPDRLVMLLQRSPAEETQQVSYPEYKFYRDNNDIFSGLAAFNSGIGIENLAYRNATYRPVINTVSENYFEVLGVSPAFGRSFSGTDSAPQSEVVLSYPFWKRLGDPKILGHTVKLGKYIATVVGVAPKNFSGSVPGFAIDVWVPLRVALGSEDQANLERRENRWLTMFGRLRPGVTRQKAQAAVQVLGERQAHDFPKTNKETTARISPFSMLPYQHDLVPNVLLGAARRRNSSPAGSVRQCHQLAAWARRHPQAGDVDSRRSGCNAAKALLAAIQGELPAACIQQCDRIPGCKLWPGEAIQVSSHSI